MSARTQRARGAAVVETALGVLVFISMLMFGIAFGEVGFLSMKVHEAATAALWDTTARKLHEHATDFRPRDKAIDQAGPRATRRYAGFDGREAKEGQRDALEQVFVRAHDLDVRCRADRVLRTSLSGRPAFPGGEGGMQCTARAELSWVRLPLHFLDQGDGAFFERAHVEHTAAIPICALGRASAGRCRGRFSLLLDDWGLSGEEETRDCKLKGCKNDAYRDLVEGLYDRVSPEGGRESARAFAQGVTHETPGDPARTFRFSFVNTSGDPTFRARDLDPSTWMTNVRTGSRNIRYEDRDSRFLGQKGPL
jgi:hypothetical protein